MSPAESLRRAITASRFVDLYPFSRRDVLKKSELLKTVPAEESASGIISKKFFNHLAEHFKGHLKIDADAKLVANVVGIGRWGTMSAESFEVFEREVSDAYYNRMSSHGLDLSVDIETTGYQVALLTAIAKESPEFLILHLPAETIATVASWRALKVNGMNRSDFSQQADLACDSMMTLIAGSTSHYIFAADDLKTKIPDWTSFLESRTEVYASFVSDSILRELSFNITAEPSGLRGSFLRQGTFSDKTMIAIMEEVSAREEKAAKKTNSEYASPNIADEYPEMRETLDSVLRIVREGVDEKRAALYENERKRDHILAAVLCKEMDFHAVALVPEGTPRFSAKASDVVRFAAADASGNVITWGGRTDLRSWTEEVSIESGKNLSLRKVPVSMLKEACGGERDKLDDRSMEKAWQHVQETLLGDDFSNAPEEDTPKSPLGPFR